ncbi:accessory factor UbiK family protein [Thiohalorhabdus sp.]|uniref:accessory factor UbiK family protein n=1 Tax=Thiohalorhabdus sp. TaxID=3094134 RepID=UPI002FC326FB
MSQSSSGMLDNLAREIGQALGRLGLPPERIEEAVRDAVRPVLERMDLITREEFEQQQQALEQTRRRVEALEAKLGVTPPPGSEGGTLQTEPLATDPGDPSADYDPNEPRK